jgi:rubrerythrin
MAKSLKGTKTEKNLLAAFAGESQARNRYTYAVSVAKKEGYVQISAIFEETANHEKEHAKRLFKFLEGGDLEITAAFPAGKIGNTVENLIHAYEGEHHENAEMYPEFAKIAKEEGFDDIAKVFANIGEAEKWHEERYRALEANIKACKVFKREEAVSWSCKNCGHTSKSNEAPEVCPACAHPRAHFELTPRNW